MNPSRWGGMACAGILALGTSLSVNASFVIQGGSSQSLPINLNNFNTDLMAQGYDTMYKGAQLRVSQTGFVTYTYIAAESAFNDFFNTPSGSMAEADDAFNINGYDSITVSVTANDILNFSFTSDGGANALTPVDNFNATNLQGLGIYTPNCGLSVCPSYGAVILGYDDQSILDDDNHDDMLVLVEFSPVPVPAAAWLFGSGLLGLIGIARKKKAT